MKKHVTTADDPRFAARGQPGAIVETSDPARPYEFVPVRGALRPDTDVVYDYLEEPGAPVTK
jgi:hypothetical protein